jgi:AraC-like DNA-binding protein
MQYVLKKRMQMAEGILSDPNASFTVTEIADRCGFPDVEYFSKKFKETHGISPSLWRQQHTQVT